MEIMFCVILSSLLLALVVPFTLSASSYNVSLGTREGKYGNTVSALCTGAFSQPSQLVWYYNGSENHHCLDEATRTNLSITVHIPPNCEGYLQCGNAETLSRSVPLYAYPEFTSSELTKTVSVTESTTVTLACNPGVSALHNFNISWLFRPAGSLPSRTIPTTSPDYSLILYNVNQSNSGVYQCQVNARTSVFLPNNAQLACQQGVAINLTVEQYDPPRFTSSLLYSAVNVTETLFTISAVGTAPLNYTWFLNNTQLSSNSSLVRLIQGNTLVLASFPADGTIIRVVASNLDTEGMINSTSLTSVLVTRVVRTGLTDPFNLPSFIGTIIIAVIGCATVAVILVLLAVACRFCLRWMRNKQREKQMNSYYAMHRPETPSSYTESTASTSQSITAVVNIVYAAGDLLSYNKEPDMEIIEALYHFLPVVLNHSEHSDAHDSVQRVKRNLQLLHCSLSLQGGGGAASGYDSDTTYSTTDDQVPLHTSQL